MKNREEYDFNINIVEKFLKHKFRQGHDRYAAFFQLFGYNVYLQDFHDDAAFLSEQIRNSKVSQDIIDQIIEFQIANL